MNYVMKNRLWTKRKAPWQQKSLSIMRVVLIFLLLGTLQSVANTSYSQSTKLSLHMNDATIQEVLLEIEKNSSYYFSYNTKQIDATRKISINREDKVVMELLDEIFAGKDIKYSIDDTHIILYKNKPGSIAQQRQKQVTGIVTDETGEPVIGANVVEKGTTNGVITDIDGKFTLLVADNAVFQVSYIGYVTQEVSAKGGSTLKIVLRDDSELLDEVIVIGYGTARKSDLTGTVASVNAESLEKIQSNSLLDRIQGTIPGLNIRTTDAQPGKEQEIVIRGEKSLSAKNSPLVIMDGIPYSGDLHTIDPGIIENMSVLKDASSAAIYGSKASNGVILITTKRGRSGSMQIAYKGQVAISSVERRMKMMKGAEYVKYVQDYKQMLLGYEGDDLDPMKLLKPSERDNYANGIETDWQDVIFRDVFTHNHQVSLSGGSDKNNYYGAISYADQPGIVKNTNFSRINATLNLDQSIKKWLKVGLSMQFSEIDKGGVTPNIWTGLGQSPYGPVYDSNGNWYDYPSDDTFIPNPMSNTDAIDDHKLRSTFMNTYALIQLPIKGLSYRANFGYNYRSEKHGSYHGRNTLTGRPKGGYAKIENKDYFDWNFENIVNYERDFGKHSVKATGLFSLQKTMDKKFEGTGEMFVNDDSYYHNIGMAEKNVSVKSGRVKTTMVSYMGRLNYGYDNRYLLTLTARGDAYSAFGENNKWALFPSVAGAWVVSQEEFMSGTKEYLDFLKVRLSYGANGNQAIDAYRTLDRLKLSKYIWDKENVNGAYLPMDGIGNPNLKWETTRSVNFGIDFGFLQNRISGNVELYKSKTKDLLMKRFVPVMNGFNTILDNIGSTQNKGIEITLRTRNIEKNDFTWSSMINYAANRDKITELRGDGKDDVANKWFIGKPLRVIYDYEWTGVWQLDDDPDLMAQYSVKPGYAKLKDQDDDGKINANDKVVIGSKAPKFTLGFANDFTYKNFYLSVFMDGVFKVTSGRPEKNFVTIKNYVKNPGYWTPDNPTNKCPSPIYTPYDVHGYYYKVNYFRIKNITLGYNIPRQPLVKLGISDLGVYMGINNAYTFTNHIGQSVDGGDYPTARSFTLGVNVTF